MILYYLVLEEKDIVIKFDIDSETLECVDGSSELMNIDGFNIHKKLEFKLAELEVSRYKYLLIDYMVSNGNNYCQSSNFTYNELEYDFMRKEYVKQFFCDRVKIAAEIINNY